MTAIDTTDLYVVTGPLEVDGEPNTVFLYEGEVVRFVGLDSGETTPLVEGLTSGYTQYIDFTSLTPLSDIHNEESK